MAKRTNNKATLQILMEKSSANLADYFTKHFTEKHHKNIRATYVTNF